MPQSYSPLSSSDTATISELDLEKPLPTPIEHEVYSQYAPSQPRQSTSRVHNWALYMTTGVSFILLISNVVLLHKISALNTTSCPPSSTGLHLSTADPSTQQPAYAVGGGPNDAATIYPPFSNHTTFEAHPLYQSFNETFDPLWHDMQSPNGGFFIQDSSVPAGKIPAKHIGKNGKRHKPELTRHQYGISMFHQLHCLQNLRGSLALLNALATGTGNLTELTPYLDRYQVLQPGRWDAEHVGHCVDYIRQGILCAADPTLEAPHYNTDEVQGLDMISGLGVTHQCRNADGLWEWSLRSGWVDDEVMQKEMGESERRKNAVPGWRRVYGEDGKGMLEKTSGEMGRRR